MFAKLLQEIEKFSEVRAEKRVAHAIKGTSKFLVNKTGLFDAIKGTNAQNREQNCADAQGSCVRTRIMAAPEPSLGLAEESMTTPSAPLHPMAAFLSQTRVSDFIHPKVIASLTPNDNIETILQVCMSSAVTSPLIFATNISSFITYLIFQNSHFKQGTEHKQNSLCSSL